uniref:Uncharacterized protein n=1 Tax=Romanomermis culicivorax TaxID=13658 RepID=A0A915JAG1_ROMCU
MSGLLPRTIGKALELPISIFNIQMLLEFLWQSLNTWALPGSKQRVFDDLRLVATQEFIKLFDDFERQWMLNTMYIDLGSHFLFNKLIEKNHPNLYELICGFKMKQARMEAIIQQTDAGQAILVKNKLYLMIDQRLQRQENRLNDGEIDIDKFLHDFHTYNGQALQKSKLCKNYTEDYHFEMTSFNV